MKILEHLLIKMITLYEEFSLRKMDLRAIWIFYKCYALSMNFLGIHDRKLNRKNILWKEYSESCRLGKENYKAKNKLYIFIQKDMIVVMKALRVLSEENEKAGLNKSEFWERGALGLQNYEIEEREGNGI